MFIVRDKEGNIIAIASKQSDAEGIASTKLNGAEYVVQESTDSVELREVYRSYYKTR